MYCYCCTTQYAGVLTALCEDCHKIRHLQSVYGVPRVLEVLEQVLVRDESKQKHKIDSELKREKEKLETNIKTRSQTKTV